jgi:uncharacterized membrane protein YqjE
MRIGSRSSLDFDASLSAVRHRERGGAGQLGRSELRDGRAATERVFPIGVTCDLPGTHVERGDPRTVTQVRTEELSERSVGDLVQELSQQTAALVRQEMRLAQVELQEKGKRAGIGAGMFGGAGLVALYGVGAVIAAVIMLVATAIEPWVSGLIVGAVLLITAGILALLGRRQVEQATPPKPERAMESVQDDVEHVRERVSR